VSKIKTILVTALFGAVSLTSGISESFAGVATTAGVAPALTTSAAGSATEQVFWRGGWRGGWGGGWRGGGWGWRGGYGYGGWHRGYGWGWTGPAIVGGALLGGAIVANGCWQWVDTYWGPRRVWVC